MSVAIHIDDMSLKFRIYRNPTHSIKQSLLGMITRKGTRPTVHEFYALKDVTLDIEAGDRLGVIGLNGAGKSTLLKTIAGIYPPDSGRIAITGKVNPLIEIGVGFDIELTGRENIYVSAALLGWTPEQVHQSETDVVAFAELQEFIDTPVKYYSAGMYGRLAFSIATMIEPEILLVDEVFAAGDAHFVDKASKRMLDLMGNSQIVVFVSHGLEQIVNLCNRAIVVHQGKIMQQGPPQEMVNYYLSEIVARA